MAFDDCGFVSLDDPTAVYKWGPSTNPIYTSSLNDGLANSNMVSSVVDLYPAFGAVAALNKNQTRVTWYLPSQEELITVVAAAGGGLVYNAWKTYHNLTNSDRDMLPGTYYWSSTYYGSKSSNRTVRYFSWEKNEDGQIETLKIADLDATKYSVRAIAQFDSVKDAEN